jgi:S1-C subfamily serine protease
VSNPEAVPPVETMKPVIVLQLKLSTAWTAPLLVEPPLIEDLAPQVEGVIKGSPAEKAGFKAGDLIDA